uniref:Uncharacterized protein n=1 Tax=virus sp. ctrcb4 TaxID=2825824 RepID=A0A8S5RP46_9VIRU|nr:MAG TPA: hypothetical protein [virus sp. ctrcb4]DAR12784.1 MAG TPA: hypothetical protein [Crassvirales sp.]
MSSQILQKQNMILNVKLLMDLTNQMVQNLK